MAIKVAIDEDFGVSIECDLVFLGVAQFRFNRGNWRQWPLRRAGRKSFNSGDLKVAKLAKGRMFPLFSQLTFPLASFPPEFR